MVEASLHYDQPEVLARVSEGLGAPMHGIDVRQLPPNELLQAREAQPPVARRPGAAEA